MKCYVCFERNAGSLEHIVPVFLGGKKRMRLLCFKCNNKFGSTIEQRYYKCEKAKEAVELKIALNKHFSKGGKREDVLAEIEKLKSFIF